MKRYVISVSGNVQGVYFRDTARQVATRLGLNGFARNEQDGTVYIEVEGDEKALEEFTRWCRGGPPQAFVDRVKISEGPAVYHQGFSVS